jgi:hypothetical protein
MAESRDRAGDIPRETTMKTHTLLALAVMAATGCQTPEKMQAKGYIQTPDGEWVKKGTPFFGDGVTMKPTAGFVPAFDGSVFTQAMAAQQQAPAPVIVTGPDSGTTVATQSSYGTVVAQFGGYRPLYRPPVTPIYTGGGTPAVYTMPLQQ